MRWGPPLALCLLVLVAAGCEQGSGGERDGRRDHAGRDAPARTPPREERREHADRRRPPPAARERTRAPEIPERARRTAVTGVADGDTIDLAGLGSSRLIGIDTPEVYGGAECFGARASAFAKRELPPGTAIYFVHGPEATDRYGRDLVYVWLPGGTFYNALLAKQGFAVTLTIPPNDRYADLFRRLAREARAANRGLWASSTCDGDADLPAGGSPGSSGGGGGGAGGGSATAAGGGDRDCADFATQAQAQRYFEAKGGPQRDPDLLDADDDGRACEDLP